MGARQRIPSSQAAGSSCCEPTWKHSPSGRSPSRRARFSKAAASAGGTRTCSRRRYRRRKRRRDTAFHRRARGMRGDRGGAVFGVERESAHTLRVRPSYVRRFLTVLPKVSRWPSTPAALHASISPTEATSNSGPRPRALAGRVRPDRLDGVADPRGGQSGLQLAEVLRTDRDRWSDTASRAQSQSSTGGRSGHPAGCDGSEKCSDGIVGPLGDWVDSDVCIPSTTSVTLPVSRS